MGKNINWPAYSDKKSIVFVKPISEAKTKFMKSYIIPTVEVEPAVIALHYDIKTEEITRDIVALGTYVKTDKNVKIMLGIIARKYWYKDKARNTNECVKKLCNSRNILFVEHSK